MMIFAALAWTLSNFLRTDLEPGVQTGETFSVIGLVNETYMVLRALEYASQSVPERILIIFIFLMDFSAEFLISSANLNSASKDISQIFLA